MTRMLAVLTGATTFLLCLVAVRDHASLVRAGYEVSDLERKKERVSMEVARARELVSRMRAPAALAERAAELGMVTSYPRTPIVVRVEPDRGEDRLLVRKE